MRMSQETLIQIEQDMDNEVEKRMKDTPVRVIINGMDIDIDHDDRAGGEINLFLGTPLYCDENDKYYDLVEVKEEDI